MSTVLWDSLSAWWPEVILSLGALKVILAAAWCKSPKATLVYAWLFVAAAAVALWHAPAPPHTDLFFGLIVCDPYSLVFRWIALGSVAMTLLLMSASRELSDSLRGEGIGLLLAIGVGLMLMAEANHLLMAYVAMELVGLSSYLLVGFLRDARSSEAALKYLLFGALASGIMLFGMSLLFALTGELGFPQLLRATMGLSGPIQKALLVAISLMLAGLAYKISMAPFHMWTPDVYEGAPVAVTALLSVGPKAAGLALLIRIMAALGPAWPSLMPLVLGLTLLTMTLGNVVALVQTNVKRLLAYSTIGQVGYLLIGLLAHSPLGHEALLVYLIAYLFMNFGAFACILAVVNETNDESVEAFRGLSKRSPLLALCLAIFLLSLAGIPPLLGFFGKFLLFQSALQSELVWLAIAGAVNSAIALYYYVNLIRLMYFTPSPAGKPVHPALALQVALGVCVAVTLLVGLFPGGLLEWLRVHSGILL